jgi:hypothetical protein
MDHWSLLESSCGFRRGAGHFSTVRILVSLNGKSGTAPYFLLENRELSPFSSILSNPISQNIPRGQRNRRKMDGGYLYAGCVERGRRKKAVEIICDIR